MDPISQKYYDSSQSLPPPSSSFLGSSSSHSALHHSGFPIIAVAIIGILATGILLVSYYVFVIKCCLNWHRIDLLRRFSLSGRRSGEDPLMVHSPAVENRGLDESTIRSIPIFPYRKRTIKKGEKIGERNDSECAVCLNEFQEEEKLRVIPDCAHVFHIDCIDVWLQNNANCPLCRTSVSANRRYNLDQITAQISSLSPRDPNRYRDNFTGRDEDYVVIEIRNQELQNHTEKSLLRIQERLNNNTGKEEEEQSSSHVNLISPSPRKLELQKSVSKKKKKLNHVSSMGDECIDIRKKDEKFVAIHPMRRSFSLDSASDAHLYLAVQQIIQQQRQVNDVISPVEGCSTSSRVIKRSFFSFGHGRSSRTAAVLPLHVEPFS